MDSVAVALALTDPVPLGGVADTDEENEVRVALSVREYGLPVSVRLWDGVYVGDPVRERVRVANAECEGLPDWEWVVDQDEEGVCVADSVGDGLEGVGVAVPVCVGETVNETVADTVSVGAVGVTDREAEAVGVTLGLKLRVAVGETGDLVQLRDAVGWDTDRVSLMVHGGVWLMVGEPVPDGLQEGVGEGLGDSLVGVLEIVPVWDSV
mmetsp:Transcript_51906/g.92606  ORF Transcript_51906/g.92606 Transcript_51906/m.92606 type:complete len:209 (+) Transcript_51906:2321-2947(+)